MVNPRAGIASRRLRCLLVSLVTIAIAAPVLAEPPPWAPAHGYYKKHKHQYKGRKKHYYQNRERADVLPWLGGAAVGYLSGDRCNREALGAVLGGVVGGVAGSHIGKGDGREAATIAGALIGVLVGKSIGRSMDQADQYCTGQALEYAKDGQSVEWDNPDAHASYDIAPRNHYLSRDGRYCREYSSEVSVGGRHKQAYGTACRQPDGTWQVVN